MEYDPSFITYGAILEFFWSQHSPGFKHLTQYKSAIWPTTEEQMKAALASREAYVAANGPVATDVEMAKPWHDAEEYHQKFVEKQSMRSTWA